MSTRDVTPAPELGRPEIRGWLTFADRQICLKQNETKKTPVSPKFTVRSSHVRVTEGTHGSSPLASTMCMDMHTHVHTCTHMHARTHTHHMKLNPYNEGIFGDFLSCWDLGTFSGTWTPLCNLLCCLLLTQPTADPRTSALR